MDLFAIEEELCRLIAADALVSCLRNRAGVINLHLRVGRMWIEKLQGNLKYGKHESVHITYRISFLNEEGPLQDLSNNHMGSPARQIGQIEALLSTLSQRVRVVLVAEALMILRLLYQDARVIFWMIRAIYQTITKDDVYDMFYHRSSRLWCHPDISRSHFNHIYLSNIPSLLFQSSKGVITRSSGRLERTLHTAVSTTKSQ
jgi:hypothetical protein